MQAEWNANKIAEMTPEQNLRNTCRQLEQEYVDWHRNATHGGFCLVREWPAIGECGRYLRDGVKVLFVTTRGRSIQVQDANRQTKAEFCMVPGLALNLYQVAGTIADKEL